MMVRDHTDKEEVTRDIFPFSDPAWFCNKFKPCKTKRECRLLTVRGDSGGSPVQCNWGVVDEGSGAEVGELAAAAGPSESVGDPNDPNLRAKGTDFFSLLP